MTKMAMAVVVAILIVVHAAAEPPPDTNPNSPMALWFKGLTQPHTGASCCSISDCRAVQARVIEGHYEVWSGGLWLLVPDTVILPQIHNPVGETVACINGGRVLCLVRGPET